MDGHDDHGDDTADPEDTVEEFTWATLVAGARIPTSIRVVAQRERPIVHRLLRHGVDWRTHRWIRRWIRVVQWIVAGRLGKCECLDYCLSDAKTTHIWNVLMMRCVSHSMKLPRKL